MIAALAASQEAKKRAMLHCRTVEISTVILKDTSETTGNQRSGAVTNTIARVLN